MSNASKQSKSKKYYSGNILIEVDPYKAVTEGDLRLLNFAMSQDGFDINSQKWSGWTLLHRAAENGRDDIVKILLEAGADPNIRSTWGWHTPLHMALGRAHLDAAVTLVDFGADQSKKNKYNQTAVMLASSRGFGSVVKEFRSEVIRRELQRYKEKKARMAKDLKKVTLAAME